MRIPILLAMMVLSSGAAAASFDCAKAATLVEHAICADRKLSDLDDQLAAAYRNVLAAASDANAIRARQREWLANERNKCRDSTCIQDAYAKRLAELFVRNRRSIAELFEDAARTLPARMRIPVYVPVSLQSLAADADGLCAVADSGPGNFSINVFVRENEDGNAEPPCGEGPAFVAEIHGERQPMPDMSYRAEKVALRNGSPGWFLEVSCGGSCAPATLYWQAANASYFLQMKFASTTPVEMQRKEMLDAANSLVLVPREAVRGDR